MALFCKPQKLSAALLYQAPDKLLSGNISFRSLMPDQDIDFLHSWVNLPYSKKFWQMDGSLSNLYSIYRDILNNQHAHSFIGLFNGNPVAQIDLYSISESELKNHATTGIGDCGFHLLMQPPAQMTKGISVAILTHFIRFYFSFEQAVILYAEPDRDNVLANKLAVKAGLHYLKTIQLPSKTANLYSINRSQFQSTHHDK